MATRRRDILPGKEKATSSSQTRTPKLKGTVDRTTTTTSSTAPKKPIKPAPKTTTTNISKQPVRKPIPTAATANKPSQTKPRPSVNKTVAASPKPVPKTRVASSPAPRTAPLASRTTSSSQTKSLLTGSNARRSSIGLRKKEAGTSTSTRQQQQQQQQQKQNASSSADRVEDLSMYYVPEPEIQLKDIEDFYLTEADDEIEQSLSSVEKGNIDVPSTEVHQPTRDEIAPVQEQKEALLDDTEKQEDEPVVSRENDASEEAKRPVVERKREILFLPKQQEKMHGKFESPVSNSVIEEAVNKLLEQRRNRVRALAGAFETVFSLQEK